MIVICLVVVGGRGGHAKLWCSGERTSMLTQGGEAEHKKITAI